MQRRLIVLAAGAAVLLIALLVLVWKINSSPAHEPPADELARARNAYNQRAKSEPAPRVAGARTLSRTSRPPPAVAPRRVERSRPTPTSLSSRRPAISAQAMTSRISVAGGGANDELKRRMAEANRHYDRGAYEEARSAALAILKDSPRNIRMLRIVVSTACIMGDESQAKKYAAQLPRRDYQLMQRRCKHYQITL